MVNSWIKIDILKICGPRWLFIESLKTKIDILKVYELKWKIFNFKISKWDLKPNDHLWITLSLIK